MSEKLRAALAEAIELIKGWHGPVAWEIYYEHSPEMKRLRAALQEAESEGAERFKVEESSLPGWVFVNGHCCRVGPLPKGSARFDRGPGGGQGWGPPGPIADGG